MHMDLVHLENNLSLLSCIRGERYLCVVHSLNLKMGHDCSLAPPLSNHSIEKKH